MPSETLRVRLVSPEKTLFEGDALGVVAPAWDGRVGILRGHAPFMTLLAGGELAVDLAGGGSRDFYVVGGLLRVEDDHVTVLAEKASDHPPDGRERIPSWVALDPMEEADTLARGNPLV